MKYKVLEGSHRHGKTTYTTYNKGDVVDTAMDLIAMFPNKFVVVSDAEELPPTPPVKAEPKPDSAFPPFAPAPATVPPKKKGK